MPVPYPLVCLDQDQDVLDRLRVRLSEGVPTHPLFPASDLPGLRACTRQHPLQGCTVALLCTGAQVPPSLTADALTALRGTIPQVVHVPLASAPESWIPSIQAAIGTAGQLAALYTDHRRSQAFLQRIPDGILTLDAIGRILSANPVAQRLLGLGPNGSYHGQDALRWLPFDDLPAILGSPSGMCLLNGRRPDGSVIPLEASVFEAWDGEQQVVSVILRDRSEQIRADRLAQEKERAEQQAAAKTSFLATMSHEIRTPMNGVLGTLELLEATGLSSEQSGLLRICEDSAHYLLTIIDDILDFSKIDAGKLLFDEAPTSLDEVVFSVAELLSSRAWGKDLELVTFVDNALPHEVQIDSARLRQILINLVGNAIKFTHQGQVSVRVRPVRQEHGQSADPGDSDHLCRVRFEVTDTGIGLDHDQVSRLFRPFEQAEAGTTRRFGGTGLGLAISRRLVEMMAGEIGVNAMPGQGSTFWFELPLPVITPPQPRLRLSPVRLLLVAANPIFRDAMERGLAGAGARVDTVDSVSDAIALARQTDDDPYALMVVEDGCAASHGAYSGQASLRDPALGALPVLLMARRDRGPITTVLSRTGADYGLSRPTRPGLLIKTVAVAIGQHPPSLLEEDQRAARASAWYDDTALRFGGGAVLVAEDTPTSQLVVTKMLQRMGIDPVVVDNGLQAWDVLRHQPFDLLITDGHMPELDGFQLAARLRAAEAAGACFSTSEGAALPIVALSAGVTEEEKAHCQAVGMNGFLAKPVESQKLRKALLTFMPAHWHPVATADEHTPPLSPYRQTAARCGQPIAITLPRDQAPAAAVAPPQPIPASQGDVLKTDLYHELFGSITDDVLTLLDGFLSSAEQLRHDIDLHLEQQDSTALARTAHRLAGAALTAGAIELGTLCQRLESALKADASWSTIRTQTEQVAPSLARVRSAISALSEPPAKPQEKRRNHFS